MLFQNYADGAQLGMDELAEVSGQHLDLASVVHAEREATSQFARVLHRRQHGVDGRK